MKYIGKSNIALRNLINIFGAEPIKSLGKFYRTPGYRSLGSDSDIFVKNDKELLHISYNSLIVVMTSRRLNIQYGIDLGSLSAEGKNFSINLLKNLLNCSSLWECLVEACSCNDIMKDALDAAKSFISPLRSLSVRVKYYYSQNDYNIEIHLRPGTTILLKDSEITYYSRHHYFGETKDSSRLIDWMKLEVLI